MKKGINNFEQNHITINSTTHGHIFNINIKINQKPKSSLNLFKNKLSEIIQCFKKIIAWLRLF